MKRLMLGVYVLMAVWLVIAGGRRVAMLLLVGGDLDWSPFVSGAIGLAALLILLLNDDEWSRRRDR